MIDDIPGIKQKALKDFNAKHYLEAIAGFEQCIDFYNNNGDELSSAEMRNNLSVSLLKTRDAEKAYQVVNGTDQIFSDHGDKKKQAMALANTAAALEALERKEEALDFYEQSLDIFKEIGEKDMRSEILRRVSELQFKTNKKLQAIASMESAYNIKDNKSLKDSIFRSIFTNIRKRLIK